MPEGKTGHRWFNSSAPGGRPSRGLTLIELLISLALMALLIGFGLPSLGSLIARTAHQAQVDQLLSQLQQARSLAILRNTQVLLCPIDPGEPDAGCHGGRHDWGDGYALFDEPDGSVLAVQPGDPAVRISSWPTRFVFTPDGSLNSAVGGRFILCDRHDRADRDADRDPAVAAPSRVVLSGPGRVRVAVDEDLDCDW